jgi:hypothetical protein
MKIRMLKPYGAYKAGQVIDLPQRQADGLVTWEYAEAVRDQQQTLIETASVDPQVETADVTPRRKRP